MATLEMTAIQPPFKINELLHARWAIDTLKAGLDLDLFSKLVAKPLTAIELSEKVGAKQKGVELILNALVSLEFLEKKNGSFALTELSRLYLVPESKLYMGSFVTEDRHDQAWSNLAEAVKTGQPAVMVNQQGKAEEFFPGLAAAIFPMGYSCAQTVATELKAEQLPPGTKILDIAAGSGVWSLPFAERNKNLRVDALDFPAVLEVTKRFAQEHGVAEQYAYISGNWSECKIEADHYDFVMLGHILHSEGKQRSEALLQAAHRCLKKGGKLVIAEMISDNDRSTATFAQLFALNMYLMTEDGCVFSESELYEIIAAAGFRDIVRLELPFFGVESPVMIASK